MSEAKIKELESRLRKAHQRLDYYKDHCDSLSFALQALTRDKDKFFGRKQLPYGGIYLHGLLSQVVQSVFIDYIRASVLIFWKVPDATTSEGKVTLVESQFRFDSLIKEPPPEGALLLAWERDLLRAAFTNILSHERDESLRDPNGLPFYELHNHEQKD